MTRKLFPGKGGLEALADGREGHALRDEGPYVDLAEGEESGRLVEILGESALRYR